MTNTSSFSPSEAMLIILQTWFDLHPTTTSDSQAIWQDETFTTLARLYWVGLDPSSSYDDLCGQRKTIETQLRDCLIQKLPFINKIKQFKIFDLDQDGALIDWSMDSIQQDVTRRHLETYLACATLDHTLPKLSVTQLTQYKSLLFDLLKQILSQPQGVTEQGVTAQLTTYVLDLLKIIFPQPQQNLPTQETQSTHTTLQQPNTATNTDDLSHIIEAILAGKATEEQLAQFGKPDQQREATEYHHAIKTLLTPYDIPWMTDQYASISNTCDVMTQEHTEKINKTLLLLQCTFLAVTVADRGRHILPLRNIYGSPQGAYKKYRGRVDKYSLNTLNQQKNRHSSNIGIFRQDMSVPALLQRQTACPTVYAADMREPNMDAERTKFFCQRGTLPFVNSISGVTLCIIKCLLYLQDNPANTQGMSLPFSQIELVDCFKCFISSMLYVCGGHSIYEFLEPFSLPEIQKAWGKCIKQPAQFNMSTLFFEGTENQTIFIAAMRATTLYYIWYLHYIAQSRPTQDVNNNVSANTPSRRPRSASLSRWPRSVSNTGSDKNSCKDDPHATYSPFTI